MGLGKWQLNMFPVRIQSPVSGPIQFPKMCRKKWVSSPSTTEADYSLVNSALDLAQEVEAEESETGLEEEWVVVWV